MGCQAITPHLVSLAKRLEGRPFHLIASYCQAHQTKDQVIAYVKGKGVAPNTPNFTVSNQTRHPKVKGNGYVPYYMVFDHRGKLVHHHMCGAYHGGDGLKMIEWVDKLLDAAPDVYLGEDSFDTAAKLADQIRGKKKMGSALKNLERQLASERTTDEERADLEKLKKAVAAWRDRRLLAFDDMMADKPSQVLASLSDLEKDLKGTSLVTPVTEKKTATSGSEEFKRALAIEKKLDKVEKSLGKMKPCKNCKRSGLKHHNGECPSCKRMNAKKMASAKKSLTALEEDAKGLPISKRLESLIGSLP